MATAMNAKRKASEEHWKLMEQVCTAAEEGFDPEKAAMAMAQLLFEAYEKDLFLVIGCIHQPETCIFICRPWRAARVLPHFSSPKEPVRHIFKPGWEGCICSIPA